MPRAVGQDKPGRKKPRAGVKRESVKRQRYFRRTVGQDDRDLAVVGNGKGRVGQDRLLQQDKTFDALVGFQRKGGRSPEQEADLRGGDQGAERHQRI